MTLLGYLFGNVTSDSSDAKIRIISANTAMKRTPKGFRVETNSEAGYGAVWVKLYAGTRQIGSFIAAKNHKFKRLEVRSAVMLKGYERRGLGTKGYEALAAWACANNFVLTSDQARTDASEGFWKKQLTKGRAEYVTENRQYQLTSCAGDLGRLSRVRRQ